VRFATLTWAVICLVLITIKVMWLDQVNRSPSFTSPMCAFSLWESRTQPVTSEFVIDNQLSLSAHVAAVCRLSKQAVRSLFEDASKTLVQSSCPVSWTTATLFFRHLGRTDEPFAVVSECRCPSGYWYSTFKVHNADAPCSVSNTGYWYGTPAPTHRLQGCHARSSIAVWHFAIVPSQRPPSCRRCSWPTTIRSTASRTCLVCDADISTFGDRAFAAAGPGLWNSFPPSHLKEADFSYNRFWRSLKSLLFGLWGHGAVWNIWIAPSRNDLTYLFRLLTYFLPKIILHWSVYFIIWNKFTCIMPRKVYVAAKVVLGHCLASVFVFCALL